MAATMVMRIVGIATDLPPLPRLPRDCTKVRSHLKELP